MMLVIYGPTQTGKTALAIKLAKKLNGEVISADSRQIYKKLDIGSGKVDFGSKVVKKNKLWNVDGINIHGFDIVNPEKPFSALDFKIFASKKIEDILKKGKTPIIAGGTGFYITSLLYGLDTEGIPPNLNLRKSLQSFSVKDLHLLLAKINKRKAESLNNSDKNNPRRLIRAIEIEKFKKTSRVAKKNIKYKYKLFPLTAPNVYLYNKADKWLDLRIEKGLIDEVKGLIDIGVNTNWLVSLGLEYRWITRYVLEEITFKHTLQRLEGDIHSLIKRQKTYFNKFKLTTIYDVSLKNWQQNLEKNLADCYTHYK